jgi:hypothetical protein
MADTIDVVQFFEHPAVRFPIERDTDDFESFVAAFLQAYVEFVKSMNPADSITAQIKGETNKIELFCRSLNEAICEYSRGLPHKAYSKLDEGIKSVLVDLKRCMVTNVKHPTLLKALYRIRKEHEPGVVYTKPELFHIPFHEKHKVTRQRYSIPGLPCLYLGGSLYICWEELRRPRFESVHAARFEVATDQTISVLDFMMRPQHMAQGARDHLTANDDDRMRSGFCAVAVCWPLMAAASIRRRHGDSPFISEYIIPQLILQWITENNEPDLDGIAYSSVSCRTHVNSPDLIANFVFPAKEIVANGYCKRLRRKFMLTNPVAWNVLRAVKDIYFGASFASPQGQIEIIPGHSSFYYHTEWGDLEGKLCGLTASSF